jgi:hypothetical protein
MKIKVPFCVPTADLKNFERKILNVDAKISESMEVSGNIEYSVTIPDYMFNELANTEPKFKTEYDINTLEISGLFSQKTIKQKFQKTQTALLISQLQEYIASLTTFINDRHSVETSTMKKKIFISFNHSDNQTKNNLNGAYTGRKISQSFQFFTGYEVMTKKFSKIGEGIKKQYLSKIYYSLPGAVGHKNDTEFKEKDDLYLQLNQHGESIESFESKYSIIDWTEEREQFCKQIQDTFVKVNKELEEFLKKIDNNKMDALMSGNGLKFLNA